MVTIIVDICVNIKLIFNLFICLRRFSISSFESFISTRLLLVWQQIFHGYSKIICYFLYFPNTWFTFIPFTNAWIGKAEFSLYLFNRNVLLFTDSSDVIINHLHSSFHRWKYSTFILTFRWKYSIISVTKQIKIEIIHHSRLLLNLFIYWLWLYEYIHHLSSLLLNFFRKDWYESIQQSNLSLW